MMLKGICGVRDEKGLCDKEEIKKVCVMGERGYLSRTSRPRNAFSPPHPLRWKTGNAFLPQTYKLPDYQSLI